MDQRYVVDDFNNTLRDVFYREPTDPKSIYICKLCGIQYKGCWRGQVSYKNHLLTAHGINVDKPVIENMEQVMEMNKLELHSDTRVDILPNSSATIKIEEKLPLDVETLELANAEYQLVDKTEDSITIFNPTIRTYSIYPDDVIASVTLPRSDASTNIISQEVSEAFAETGEFVECPLCNKQYSNDDLGHNKLQKHMEKVHEVSV